MKFDEAFNKNDAVAVAAFITANALWTTPHGTLSGREVIETDYAEHEFRQYRCNNLSTKIDRVDAVGKDVRATGTWSCTFQDDFGHTKRVKGQTGPEVRAISALLLRRQTRVLTPFQYRPGYGLLNE